MAQRWIVCPKLLSRSGSLEELNRLLSSRIESGELDFDTPGLIDHVWQTTMGQASGRPAELCVLRAASATRVSKVRDSLMVRRRFVSAVLEPWGGY